MTMQDVQIVNHEIRPTVRQWEAMRALQLPQTDADWLAVDQEEGPLDILYGGAKGGGKSHWLCEMVYTYALIVAAFFKLAEVLPGEDVPHIGWIGRKVAQVFVGTTLETWKTIIPRECYTLVAASEKHPRHIRIADRVAIDYGGLDSRADLERFNSAQYGIIGVDQAEETLPDDVSTLRASRRLRLFHPQFKRLFSLPFRGLWTANPRQCWLKGEFIDQSLPRRVFVPALHSDNPHLPAGYVKTLEDSFAHRPDLLRAYRDGDWKGLSGVDQVVLEEWIAAAKFRSGRPSSVRRWISIDPARFGDDDCVIIGGENTQIVDAAVLPFCGEPQIVLAAEAMAERMGDSPERPIPIIVEVVGVCGVGDYLRQHGRCVIEYSPATAPLNNRPGHSFYNLRAEAWSTVARWLFSGFFDDKGGIMSLPEPQGETQRLVWLKVCEQLTWPTYDFRGEKVLISSKEEIKAAHSGKSPDYADAYVNGVFHLPRVTPQVSGDRQMREYEREHEEATSGTPMRF